MARFKVPQLKAKLAEQGVDTTGIKRKRELIHALEDLGYTCELVKGAPTFCQPNLDPPKPSEEEPAVMPAKKRARKRGRKGC